MGTTLRYYLDDDDIGKLLRGETVVMTLIPPRLISTGDTIQFQWESRPLMVLNTVVVAHLLFPPPDALRNYTAYFVRRGMTTFRTADAYIAYLTAKWTPFILAAIERDGISRTEVLHLPFRGKVDPPDIPK